MVPDQAGQPSTIFGERYPYPFDGKTVLFQIATEFAKEVNEGAIARLGTDGQWNRLDVTTAYPTRQQQCPRMAVLRLGSTPKPSGLGQEWDEQVLEADGETIGFRRLAGQVITEQLECAICAINERLRDDLHLWFQQYVLDAAIYTLPQLRAVGFYDLACSNAVDDQVEYQGAQSQPGFEFYVSRLTFTATYDLVILKDIDAIKGIFNWESLRTAEAVFTGAVGEPGNDSAIPPDSLFVDSDLIP